MTADPITPQLLTKMAKKGLLDEQKANRLREDGKEEEKSIAELIVEQKLMTESELLAFLSREFGCAPINPKNFRIDEDVLRLIPEDFAWHHRVIPVSVHGSTVTVAMENPTDLDLVDDMKAITNLRVKPAVALSHTLTETLLQYYPEGQAKKEPSAEQTLEDLIRIVQDQKAQEEVKTIDLLKRAQETPVIKVANMLLADAIKRRASDLFIEPWETSIRVRCRVDGLLEELSSPPKNMGQALVSRFKVMSQLNIAERRIPQDGRFRIRVQNREVDIRTAILPTSFGEKVCLRILDSKAQAHNLEKLGFTPSDLSQLKACALKPHGMILVTGPTGSGKTTTLYSVLKFLDSPQLNITTVEDPVEYQIEGINQVHVKEAIGLTFPAALRSILRQDPDVILIGEIRDVTTMDIAIKAALTGHLVLSTLHTNDTVGSIVRILNMGIEPFLITSSVLMVTAQRLVRKLCKACRDQFDAEPPLVEQLRLAPEKKYVFFRPKGCNKCRRSGYAGRTVITEILVFSNEIKSLVAKRTSAEALKQAARRQGMLTLRESALSKALAGETSLDEVLRVTAQDRDLNGNGKEKGKT